MTREYWTSLPAEYQIESKFIQLADIRRGDVDWCNILVMIRPNNAYSWRIAKKARKSGRTVITMCDDDLLHLPKNHPDLPWQKKGLLKALSQSQILMTPSRFLLKKMIPLTEGKRGVCVDTVVRNEDLCKRDYNRENHDSVKIVYAAGGGQHESMFEILVLPGLKKVAEHTSHRLSITFISVHPDCAELEKLMDVSYVKGMPLAEYREYMEEQKFDIGVSPLEDNEFTRCKYFNKYLEYTLTGIVGVYSNVEPYISVVQDGINGFLADNDDGSWEDKLTAAIENTELRVSCAKNAQIHVRDHFDEGVIMDQMIKDIPELQCDNAETHPCGSFSVWLMEYRLLRLIEYFYKTLFYLRVEGFRSVIRKTRARLGMRN